jgi:hypothetical protein
MKSRTPLLITVILLAVLASATPSKLTPFPKNVTQFDGVIGDEAVRFLKLKRNQGVRLSVASMTPIGKPVDFTVMIWFKLQRSLSDLSLKKNSDVMHLFSFPNSLKCYVTIGGIIGCDSENLPHLRLLNLQDLLKADHWFHLTVSGQS